MMRRRVRKEPIPLLDLAMLAVVTGFFTYSGLNFWYGKPRAPAVETARNPATFSAPAAPSATDVKPEQSTHVLNIECVGSEVKPLRTQANLLRLEGKLCGPSRGLSGKNATTAEELHIFLKGNSFTSHYFPLSTGANRIELELRNGRGAKLQAFEVTREAR